MQAPYRVCMLALATEKSGVNVDRKSFLDAYRVLSRAPIREVLLHLLLGKQRLKEVLPIGIIIFVLGEKRKLLPLSRLMTFLKEIIMSAAIIEGLCRYY